MGVFCLGIREFLGVFCLGIGEFPWSSKEQSIVVLSTIEYSHGNYFYSICKTLSELKNEQKGPINILYDKRSAIITLTN